MAIAYVSVSGSGTYPGTPSAPTNLSAALSTAAAGDTVYIATGTYRAAFTLSVSGSAGSAINFIGDSTNAQNINGASGYLVRITNYVSDTASPTDAPALTASARSYVNFNSIYFDAFSTTGVIALSAGTNITFTKCVFATTTTGHGVQHTLTSATGPALSLIQCVYVGNGTGYLWRQLGNYTVANMACYITDCLSIGGLWFVNGAGSSTYGSKYDNVYFYNNTVFQGSSNPAVQMQIVSPGASTMYFYNNFIVSTIALTNVVSTTLAENYNTFIGTRTNIAALSANDRTASSAGFAFDYGLLTGTVSIPFFAPYLGSVNQGAGTLSGAPATDLYSRAWSVTTPDIGSTTNFANTGITAYLPTERNASTITIAPGSTSQSIELYLGATGLTASTSGLSAYYNRTRTADVQIPLVARTIAQAWTAGGFAEVNASTMPGVYRLDIPNEALASGADDVTIVVRGASGTNGAVMSIKLSSGGLTSTQTAQAVWNALTSSHTTHGTFGWNSLRADAPSKEGLVTLHQSGGVSRIDADVHAVQNDTAAATTLKGALLHDGTGYVDADVVRISTSTAAANELEGALLHNGTDYIDSNLIGGNSTRVFVGRFDLRQTGSDDVDTIEVFTTDTPSFELQLTDGDGNEVPVTGATLGLRILDVASTVVETGTPTVEYGTGGIVRWTGPGTYLAIGCPVGMYRLFIDRTVSGTTTTFGPLQIKVQAQ